MGRIFSAVAVAFVNLLHPRMLWLMIWPILIAVFGWGLLGIWSGLSAFMVLRLGFVGWRAFSGHWLVPGTG